jgi:hypothetical protein
VSEHSLFDWVSVLGPILLSWPLLIVVALLFFYKPIFALLDHLANQNIQKAKIGPFEIEEASQPYLESLKLLLSSFVTDDELAYLQQLNREDTAAPYDDASALHPPLYHLSALGLIEPKTDLDDLPVQGDLSHHVILTRKGKTYLSLHHNLVEGNPQSTKEAGNSIET